MDRYIKALDITLYVALVAIPWLTVPFIAFCSILRVDGRVYSDPSIPFNPTIVLCSAAACITVFALSSRAVRMRRVVMPALTLPYLANEAHACIRAIFTLSLNSVTVSRLQVNIAFDVFVIAMVCTYIIIHARKRLRTMADNSPSQEDASKVGWSLDDAALRLFTRICINVTRGRDKA